MPTPIPDLARLEALFERAAALPPADRPAFLAAACGDDIRLRADVEAMLRADSKFAADGDTFLRGPVAAARESGTGRPAARSPALTPPPADNPDLRCDGYRLLRKVGDGGMGTVYEAEQDNPRRRVAIKMIRSGMASRELLRRFGLEAQVLARLRHPGIAQILEAGEAANGQPFIAMEFVPGETLVEYVRNRGLPVAERLALVARVCEAVHHAHTQGIVHRDLKPANILVDEAGHPRVLDFGVARATGPDAPTSSGTEIGQLVGTPAYMSPEQLSDPARIDHRTDVYALGVILYELLADRPPFDLKDRSLAEIARVICGQEPPALGTIDRAYRGDIETVVSKALEKDPASRYRGALDLGDDLRRHLAGQPILARPLTAVGRAVRWCRRNPRVAALAATAAMLFCLLGVGGAVAGVAFSRQAERQRELAEKAETARALADAEAKRATQVTDFLKGLFDPHDPVRLGGLHLGSRTRPGGTDLTGFLRQGAEKLAGPGGFRDQPLVRAELLHSIGTAYHGLGHPKEAAPLLEEALALRRGHLPADDPDLGDSVLAVAQTRSLFDDQADARLFREAIAIRSRQPNGELATAEAEVSYALFRWYLDGETTESRATLQRVEATSLARLGDTNLRTQSIRLLLMFQHLEADRPVEAAAVMASLLDSFDRGGGNSDVHDCCRQILATFSTKALRGDRAAVAPGRAMVAKLAQVFGEHHYVTVVGKSSLAALTSDPDDKLALYRDCLRSLDTWGVPSTYLRAKFAFDLSNGLRWAEREAHLRTAIDLFRRLARKGDQSRIEYPHALRNLARVLAAGEADEAGRLLEEGRAYCAANPRVAGYRRAFAHSDATHWQLLRGGKPPPEWAAVAIDHWRKEAKEDTRQFLAEALALHAVALRRQGRTAEADRVKAEAEAELKRTKNAGAVQAHRARELLAGRVPEWD